MSRPHQRRAVRSLLLSYRLTAAPDGLDDAADRVDDNVWPFDRDVVRRLDDRERYVGNRGRQLLLRSAPRGIEPFAKPVRHAGEHC